jgi:hypothetical protein
MYYKYSKLKPHLIKSYLLLFKGWTLIWADILVTTTFLDTQTLTVPYVQYNSFAKRTNMISCLQLLNYWYVEHLE